jgi:plasmid stabilization system protein ParE
MSLAIQRAAYFVADFEIQFDWYVEKAGAELAWRFQAAVDESLRKISIQPDLGRIRRFRNPRLIGLRSFRVERPFRRLLIFYRISGDCLQAVRLMHTARDLPRRLTQPPGTETQTSSPSG